MIISIPLRAEASGMLTLGPKPGTPEFEDERRCRAAGIAYDYSAGTKLYIGDELPEPEPETLRG